MTCMHILGVKNAYFQVKPRIMSSKFMKFILEPFSKHDSIKAELWLWKIALSYSELYAIIDLARYSGCESMLVGIIKVNYK